MRAARPRVQWLTWSEFWSHQPCNHSEWPLQPRWLRHLRLSVTVSIALPSKIAGRHSRLIAAYYSRLLCGRRPRPAIRWLILMERGLPTPLNFSASFADGSIKPKTENSTVVRRSRFAKRKELCEKELKAVDAVEAKLHNHPSLKNKSPATVKHRPKPYYNETSKGDISVNTRGMRRPRLIH